MSPPNSEPGRENNRADEKMPLGWARMYVMVLEFLAYLGGLGYLGWWLEQRYGWQPWGLLVGLLLGTALGLYRMIRESKRLGL
ncbi:MAG: AtpZ/AtpI family protein [Phycisphaerae bacterium]|nr:AtpZ/AtpI family protein [Phycisphaerae bacterium]